MASSNSVFKRGDVVVVPFPYVDRLAEKRRPALVVSNEKFNESTGLLWVAMITSASNESWPNDIQFDIDKAGLTTESVIRISKLATIEIDRVVRVIGTVEKKARNAVTQAVREFTS
jgi:mRNA interferase MazF